MGAYVLIERSFIWTQERARADGPCAVFTLTRHPENGVRVITLARPPANAIDAEALAGLRALLAALAEDRSCAVVVFRGTGRFFSAGADIKLMTAGDGVDRIERLTALARDMQSAYDAIERLPCPTIAAINGIATGGGLELALACDLRVAAADAGIGLTETRIGLLPGAGGTQRLTRVAGRAVALRLILRGEIIDGREAARIGVVHEAVAAGDVEARALALAAELAAQPRAALAAAKRCIAAAPSAAGYAAEIEETRALHADPQTQARIAAFLNRRR